VREQTPGGWWQASDGRWYPPFAASGARRSSGMQALWLLPVGIVAGAVLLLVGLAAIGASLGPPDDEVRLTSDGAPVTTATTSELSSTTSTAPATTTTPPTTTTTAPPATTTTAAPPTTSAPPPPAPRQAPPAPPPAPAAGCDPNYSGCVPVASDVDCAGGSGNGPAYVAGPVTVVGADPYGLDADDDGLGCED
jgi:hypothetical protein